MMLRTLIGAGELARRLDDPRLRIVDCRFDLAQPDSGGERYRAGHLPGAVYADLNRDLSGATTGRNGRHPLPPPDAFAGRLRAWGVNDDSQVVACDDGNGMFAARLWWMLRWLGHEEVAVLDGGLQRWRELALPLVTDAPRPPLGNFRGRPRPELVADAGEVLVAAGDPQARVLDARASERYRGDIEPLDAVAGHVPGARNHPFAASLGAHGRFLVPDALRHGLATALDGAAPRATIAMCGSGVTACHLLLAMEHAGLGGARLYPGSWSEWSSNPHNPVRTGATP